MATYKSIRLASRPVGPIDPKTAFRTETHALADLVPGSAQVVVQCTWLSLDPAMRVYLNDVPSYLPPVQIGEVMRAMGLGIVIATGPGSKYAIGDNIAGAWGMTEYAVMADNSVEKLDILPGIDLLDHLNTLGTSGLTAYFGLRKIAELKPSDTILISGAAGSVGSIACQLAIAMGAKVYAIAGSPEKCRWLEEEIGVKHAFNYKDPNWFADFKNEVGYVDVYFDNVGGDALDMVLTRLNKYARIVLCGAISQYNASKPQGIKNYSNLIAMRGKMQGFIVFDYADEYPIAIHDLAKRLTNGDIKRKFHIIEGGIEQAPTALPMLFTGGNTGKLVVRVSDAATDGKTRL